MLQHQIFHLQQLKYYIYYIINLVLNLVMLNILCTTLLPIFSPVSLQNSNCKHEFSIRAENSVDFDQMASFCVEKKDKNMYDFFS